MAGKAPLIIPITKLRGDASRLIKSIERSHLPLFVTQRGYVTAVLLTPEDYDIMCVLRDKGLQAINPACRSESSFRVCARSWRGRSTGTTGEALRRAGTPREGEG